MYFVYLDSGFSIAEQDVGEQELTEEDAKSEVIRQIASMSEEELHELEWKVEREG